MPLRGFRSFFPFNSVWCLSFLRILVAPAHMSSTDKGALINKVSSDQSKRMQVGLVDMEQLGATYKDGCSLDLINTDQLGLI